MCEPRIEGIVQFKIKRRGPRGGRGEVDVNQQPAKVKKALKIVRYCTIEKNGGRWAGEM